MPSGFRVDPSSLRFSIRAIGNVKVSLRKASVAAVRAAGEAYRDVVKRNLSLTDHTLRQLAVLDHPYARRHGSIKIHAGDGGGFIDDGRNLVHRQSGNLLRSLRAQMRGASGPGSAVAYDVWLDLAGNTEVRAVLDGTPRMLPRDPLWSTALGPATIDEMRRSILRELGKVLRSQATVRFS